MSRGKRFLVRGLVCAVGLLLVLRTSLDMDTTSRILILSCLLIGLVVAAVYLWRWARSRPKVTIGLAVVLLIIAGWAAFAGREPDPAALRSAYVRNLRSYEGVRYLWGGESYLGIDCSGLARTAMWQAMVTEGIRTANPRLLGPRLWMFWWRDVSALAMENQAYGYTAQIGKVDKLAGCDHSALRPGDLATAGSGIHVLMYLGNGEWIEASPQDGRVTINRASADSDRPYFNMQATFLRWRALEID